MALTTKELVKELQVGIEEVAGVKLNQEQTRAIIDDLVNIIKGELADGGSVEILGLGKFETVQRAERKGRNPQDGSELIIPAKQAPKFKPAKALKDAVEGK